MIGLIYVHWFPLASQGNIYSLTTLKSCKCNKILVASLKRKIYCFEYQHSKWRLKPLVKELVFTYIPNGAEIIAIDSYNKSNKNTGDEFVIGITIMKPSGETSIEQYLNIYTESIGDSEDSNSLEVIAQNCLMIELSYTPYLLYHTYLPQTPFNEIVWLLSGSDYKIHLIKEDKCNQSYTESQLEKYFPELDKLEAIALGIDIYYYSDFKRRLTGVSCECGLFKLAKVNVETLKIIQVWVLRYDNPVCNVRIFPSHYEVEKPSFIEVDYVKKKEFTVNVLIISGNASIVFEDVLNKQMNGDIMLHVNELISDCILCCCIADINFDGKNEILLGTHKQELLIFSTVNNKWKMIDKKFFDAPIHSICYIDLTGDGVKVLVILTQRSVHVMQHDPKEAMIVWKEKFSKLISLMNINK